MDGLCVHANSLKERYFGKSICLEGRMLYHNMCQRNCLYCGMRRESNIQRYTHVLVFLLLLFYSYNLVKQ